MARRPAHCRQSSDEHTRAGHGRVLELRLAEADLLGAFGRLHGVAGIVKDPVMSGAPVPAIHACVT